MQDRPNRYAWMKIVVPSMFLGVVIATIPDAETQGPPPPPPVGGPLPGLSAADLNRFNAGRGQFNRPHRVEDGLGPVFNGVSCVQCHAAAAPGGASPSLGVSVVRRIGGFTNGVYSDLTNVGGALLQARSLREIIPNYPVPGEVVPTGPTIVGRRQTTPLFGAGLIEAIPASSILALQDPNDANRDGISGRANMVLNPQTGLQEPGRFGWKSQVATLLHFSGDAYLNEMGITNPQFPLEVLPQGRPIPPGADRVADPEDRTGNTPLVADFMRFLAPPAQLPNLSVRGRQLFTTTSCASCHTPTMTTGPNPRAALSVKQVQLYSDLLLHDMGALADQLRQGQATGTEFRTAPLWGLRFRRFFLHDGRATSVDQAIRLHDGEAALSRNRYNALTPADRTELLNFVNGL